MNKVHKSKIGHYAKTFLLGLFVFNIAWYLLSIFLDMNVLPTPLAVYSSYAKALDNEIVAHMLASSRRIAIGLSISLVLAVLLGVLAGYNNKANRILTPLFYFSYPLPKLAFLPVIMLLFGIGDTSKIMIIVLIIVFQMTITIRDAVRNIPAESYDILTSLHATGKQKVVHIILPAILPELFSSLRVALGIVLSALFFTETFGTDKGLGFYITDSWMRLDYVQMFFGILVLSTIGLVVFFILDWLDFVSHKWKNTLS